MKFIQDEFRSGALDVLVRCRTSLVEMLPTTLRPLSTTATLVRPSLCISVSASDRGASELRRLGQELFRRFTINLLNGNDVLGANSKIAEDCRVQTIDGWEIDSFVPEKLNEPQLTCDADDAATLVRN